MVDLLDSLKDSADDLLSKVDRSGRIRSTLDGLRRQMAESDARRLVKTLEKEVEGLRSQVDQTTNALGIQTLGLYQGGKLTHPELHPLCKHIMDMKTLLSTREKELEEAQAVLAQLLAPSSITPTPAPPLPQPVTSPPPSTTRLCASCGNPLPTTGDFCPLCGAKIAVTTPTPKFCALCGAELKPNAKFCPQCGKPTG